MNLAAAFALGRFRQGSTDSTRRIRRPLTASIAALVLAGALPTSAANWDGGDGIWSTSVGKWDGGLVWTPGGAAVFAGTPGTVTLGEAIGASSVAFNATGYVVNGSSFLLNTPSITVQNGRTATINAGLTGTAGLTIASGNGTSLLTLGGASDYSGTTTINGTGVVRLGATNALPIGTTLTQASTGNTFDLNGFDQTVLQIGGASQSTITNTSATTATLTITTGSTVTASSQVITGNLNVTKTGAGTWNPAVGHTFTGVLTLAGGNSVISSNSVLGAAGQATMVIDGSSNSVIVGFNTEAFRAIATFNRDITLVGTLGSISASGVKAATLSGRISGSGNLRLFGTTNQGAVILAGDNDYTGLTVIERTGTAFVAAHDNAFGTSSMISTSSSSTAGTVGFQRSVKNQNITVGTATDITFTASAHGSGLGSIHNFSGDNSFGGDVIMSSGTQLYAAEAGSSLLLSGVISGGRPLTKGYSGGVALSGANTYTGTTIVNSGILRLDFSQAGAPIANIVNNATNTSGLTFNGGTLEIKGRNGGAVSQVFNGLSLNNGAATVSTLNSSNGITVSFGGITRQGGTTANFVLPAAGSLETTTGTANQILRNSSGVAYATVGGNDWAAKAANGTTIVGLSSIGGYTPTTATSLAGNADVASGVDTTVGTTSNTSTRFNIGEARTITLTGDLTTGGILVTSAVGNNLSTITGGNLKGPTSNQDLVIIQNNNANVLRIESTIGNNGTTGGLVKGGSGTLELTAANSYAGPTTVVGGVLKLAPDALGLPGGIGAAGGSSNLVLNGGMLGLTSDFNRGLGTAATQVRFLGDGGFAAYGGTRVVNFGGTASFTSGNFVPVGYALLLSADDATGTVDFQSPLALTGTTAAAAPQLREIRVANGSATVDAKISGAISNNAGILKTGAGTLELSAANSYTGLTQIDGGTLLLTGTMAVSTSETTAFAVNNGSTLQIGNNGTAGGHVFFVNAGTVDFTGTFAYTAKGLIMGGGAAGSASAVNTGSGAMTLGLDGLTYNGHFNHDSGATISGNLSLGGATKTFNVNNSTAAAVDLTVSAVLSETGAAGLTKSGNGTMKLTAANTYTGVTTITAGKLLVSGSVSGNAVVQNGATLGGTGTIGGTVSVQAGATLAPGESPGTLAIGSALTFAAGAALKLEIGGATPGDGSGFYSQVNMTNAAGSISLNSAATISLSLSDGYVPQESDVFFIMNRNDGGAFGTFFSGAAEGATITLGDGVTGQITYLANWNFGTGTGALSGGNDVAIYNLIVIPEPGACTSLLFGLGSLLGLQRFRRRR